MIFLGVRNDREVDVSVGRCEHALQAARDRCIRPRIGQHLHAAWEHEELGIALHDIQKIQRTPLVGPRKYDLVPYEYVERREYGDEDNGQIVRFLHVRVCGGSYVGGRLRKEMITATNTI